MKKSIQFTKHKLTEYLLWEFECLSQWYPYNYRLLRYTGSYTANQCRNGYKISKRHRDKKCLGKSERSWTPLVTRSPWLYGSTVWVCYSGIQPEKRVFIAERVSGERSCICLLFFWKNSVLATLRFGRLYLSNGFPQILHSHAHLSTLASLSTCFFLSHVRIRRVFLLTEPVRELGQMPGI